MDNNMDLLAQHLATNLLELRQRRNLTQSALAKLVDLPRSTIANLESGTGNPSLANLARLSSALQTTIDQLLTPQQATSTLVKADETPVQERSQGHVKVYKLLPDKLPNMEIDRVELEPGFSMKGIPHTPGTKEFFHCIQGEVTVKLSGTEYVLKKGDTLAFPGQAAHTYANNGKGIGIGFSVVVMAPLSI